MPICREDLNSLEKKWFYNLHVGCISIDVETMSSVDISNVESFAVVRIKVFLWSTE